MFILLFMEFIAFPERKDALLLNPENKINDVVSESSGSYGLFFGGKCHQTYTNETYHVDEKMDWCSNIAKSKNERPWISYSIKNKAMKLTGYSIRNGCCWYECCCEDNEKVYDYLCCCRLYSFSLQGSNDNRTWKTIHKVEKDIKFYSCQFKSYDFPETESFKYIRLIQDEEYPECPACIQINQIELYGKTISSNYFDTQDDADGDESVSIIGKVKKSDV